MTGTPWGLRAKCSVNLPIAAHTIVWIWYPNVSRRFVWVEWGRGVGLGLEGRQQGKPAD